MALPIIAVVGALGAQGAGIVSAYTSAAYSTKYHIRALTSNASSDAAIALAAKPNVSVMSVDLNSFESVLSAFKGAAYIFGNTQFNPKVYASHGPEATQRYEERQGLNIARAASQTPTLRHFVWSGLPNAAVISDGKYDIPHFQSKIPAETFARSEESGLAAKTTYLHVGMYGSNLKRSVYRLIPVANSGKRIVILPCSPDSTFPFIGDDRVNVGLITQAIFNQPEKTIGRVVIGAAEVMSCQDWVNALVKSFRRQGKELDVAYVECTLKTFENLWGPFGLELGMMMKFFDEQEFGGYKGNTGSQPVLTPSDLGIAGELRSTEDCLAGLGWEAFVDEWKGSKRNLVE